MQRGSIWGHGAYQAPDWSADWLHRELTAWPSLAAEDSYGKAFDALDIEQKAALTYRLKQEYRSEEHTSELQSLMPNSYAVFCLKIKARHRTRTTQSRFLPSCSHTLNP